jgi:hypothetical protein
MLRKDDLSRHGLTYDPHFVCSQDHDLWTRAIRLLRFANVHEPLLKMRDHPKKIGRTERSTQEELSDAIRRRQLDELGVDYTVDEVRAFNRAAGGFPAGSILDLHHYESILLKVFKSNKERRIFEPDLLQSLGAGRFRAWCREALIRGQKWGRYYWHSKVRSFDSCPFRQKLGFVWRSISCP